MDQGRFDESQSFLNPMFRQQQQNLEQDFVGRRGQAMSGAGRMSGAIAQSQGMDPQKYAQYARRGAENELTPGYFMARGGLLAQQGKQGLGFFQQQNQNQYGQLQDVTQGYGNMLGNAQQQQQYEQSQPGIGDYIGAGLIGGAGAFLGPLGGALGAGLGKSMFGGGGQDQPTMNRQRW